MPIKSALIVIDVQNDFVSGSLANPHGAQAIVPTINSIRDAFDLTVFSLDWHPHHHCSFVESANTGRVKLDAADKRRLVHGFKPFESVTLCADDERAAHKQMLYPRHCVKLTKGAELCRDLDARPTDPRIYKGTR